MITAPPHLVMSSPGDVVLARLCHHPETPCRGGVRRNSWPSPGTLPAPNSAGGQRSDPVQYMPVTSSPNHLYPDPSVARLPREVPRRGSVTTASGGMASIHITEPRRKPQAAITYQVKADPDVAPMCSSRGRHRLGSVIQIELRAFTHPPQVILGTQQGMATFISLPSFCTLMITAAWASLGTASSSPPLQQGAPHRQAG